MTFRGQTESDACFEDNVDRETGVEPRAQGPGRVAEETHRRNPGKEIYSGRMANIRRSPWVTNML